MTYLLERLRGGCWEKLSEHSTREEATNAYMEHARTEPAAAIRCVCVIAERAATVF